MNRALRSLQQAVFAFALVVLATACGARVPVAEPDPETGRIDVAFAGLPAPWTDRGVVTLVGAADEPVVVDRTGSYEVPAGTYEVSVETIQLCDATYGPAAASFGITVAPGGASQLTITYATTTSVEALGFRARVTGVHSNSGPIELTADAFEAGEGLTVFGCLRSWRTGSVNDPVVLIGHHRDVLIEDAPVLATLDAFDSPCTTDPEDADPSCTVYFGGQVPFGPDAAEAARAGLLYVRAWANAVPTGILAMPLTPTDAEVVLAGGSLHVDVDAAGLPSELLGGISVCLDGPFWFDRSPVLDGEVCVGAGEHAFSDLLSGTYGVTVHGLGEASAYTALVDGSPSEVRSGDTAHVSVRFAGP